MDANFWEQIEQSKRMTGADRMTESLRLFDAVAERILAGIKAQFPGISEEEAKRIRRQRLDIIRRRESIR